MVNTILAKRVNHIVAKGGNPVWPKGSNSRGFSNLKRITQSDGFRNSPIESQQKLYDILSQLEQQSGTLGKDMFKDVARDLELYRRSLNAYHSAQQREIDAANELAAAQNRLRDVQENRGSVE